MSNKTPEIEAMLNNISKTMFGHERNSYTCCQCGTDRVRREHFRDLLSYKEFGISRWCQKCQDSFFGCDEDEDEE